MNWEEILHFDETDEEYVQALQKRCLEGGRVAYNMQQAQGWEEMTAPEVSKAAHAFAVNMIVSEKGFPDRAALLAGSPSGWRWIEKMRD